MHSVARSFLDRVRSGLSQTRNLAGLSSWIERNTRHPKDASLPWSFKEHEFQKAIMNDSANDQVVKKCAQVGLSETSLRMALGLIDIFPRTTAIYTLPTGGFATNFVKTRIDPVIQDSPELRSKLDADVDNTGVKRIGGSFLYIRGTFSKNAAISVPADILVHDEVDFSNQEVLSSYTSRLGHVKEDDIIRRRFSTPTISGYGVSHLFEHSNQQWYAVKCASCSTWQVPSFLTDVILPGFDRRIVDLEKEDLTDPRVKVDEAYLSCPRCRKAYSVANLADPDYRQWVAARPGMDRSGYQVQPFDVPTINTIPRIIRGIRDYKRKADWINFRIGQDYQDADTSFLSAAVQKATALPWCQPVPEAAKGCVMGIDVGKTSWIVIARHNEYDGLDVIHYERVRLHNREALPTRARQLSDYFGVRMTVIDAMPEWTQAVGVIDEMGSGKAYASYYSDPKKTKLSFVEADSENRIVSVDRSGIIGMVAQKVNSVQYRFAKAPEANTLQQHLDNIKKVSRIDSKGETREMWVNTGPDHYGHALFFATAASLLLNYQSKSAAVPSLPMAGIAKIGLGETKERIMHLGTRI
jgi:hypothetical protein